MTRIKSVADAAQLRATIGVAQNIVLVLLGPIGSEAERVYLFTTGMTFEPWEHVFFLEDAAVVGDPEGTRWFGAETRDRYVCVYASTQKFTSGPTSRLVFHGKPDPLEIGDVFDTVPP